MRIFFVCIYSICILLFVACNQLPEADYYEIEGVVSIEAESKGNSNNWIVEHNYTNYGLLSTEAEADDPGHIRYTFYVSNPGEYSIWLLSRLYDDDSAKNHIDFSVYKNGNLELLTSSFQFPSREIPEWVNKSKNGEGISVTISEKGFYSIEFYSHGNEGYLLDKIHFTLNNARKPRGMGYPETIDPRFDPVDQKREQLIRIPPQWAFGGLYGVSSDEETIRKKIEELLDKGIPVDALLIDNFPDKNDNQLRELSQFLGQHEIRYGSRVVERIPDTNVDFVLLPFGSDLDFVQESYEMTRSQHEERTGRGLTISGINNVYDEQFKGFPVNRYSEHQSTGFDALKDQLEKVSNPRLTTYEVPFLTHDLIDPNDVGDGLREELLKRWIQFSAFNPVMTMFPSSDKLFSEGGFSESVFDNLKKYSVLRNKLFPYIYTHAHFTRQSGEKMIQGDGLRFTQFMFGDAFLVAPITDYGARERSVYFPEGYWYDYNSDNTYEGGRSWFIEAPLESIPLYVKAGSVIPYRKFAPTIEKGDKSYLKVEVYTGDAGTFRLTEDDGETEDYLRGIAARTMFRYNEIQGHKILTIGAVQRHYRGMVTERDYEIHFLHADRPSDILINESSVATSEQEGEAYWIYEDEKGAIKLFIPGANRDEKIDIEILP